MPPLATGLVRPSDDLPAVVRNYESHGFPSQFTARPGGNVGCMSCHRDHPARWVKPLAMHHIQGPGTGQPSLDDVVVAAVECPACEERGTLALSIGPNGPVEDRLVLALVSDHAGQAVGLAVA